MARKKKSWLDVLDNELNTTTNEPVNIAEIVTEPEAVEPAKVAEVEPELPAKYAHVYAKMPAGSGIFESVTDPARWLRKNMMNAKLNPLTGLYTFNGYNNKTGKPEHFKLVKKK